MKIDMSKLLGFRLVGAANASVMAAKVGQGKGPGPIELVTSDV